MNLRRVGGIILMLLLGMLAGGCAGPITGSKGGLSQELRSEDANMGLTLELLLTRSRDAPRRTWRVRLTLTNSRDETVVVRTSEALPLFAEAMDERGKIVWDSEIADLQKKAAPGVKITGRSSRPYTPVLLTLQPGRSIRKEIDVRFPSETKRVFAATGAISIGGKSFGLETSVALPPD